MERLYNPDLMSKDEIEATYVVRQPIVDDLLSLIKHQPSGAGVQHVVIIAPRGMGKTTTLLMLKLAINESELNRDWQVIQFPEERYNIYDLADFWLEVLQHLHEVNRDDELLRRIRQLERQYSKSQDLQEAALALIRDWSSENKRRVLVLADNFDLILAQINDERDNARLRDALMNDGTFMIIGTASTFFHEARAYDQPLYNFFKIINLESFDSAHTVELLRRRADVDKRTDFENLLKANTNRIRVLQHFTGGNPRLILMLYRVITQSDISQVLDGLERLLDEVTPYYKAKIENLPPQQRKILDHIASVSGQTNEGLTPTQVAKETRITVNQASAQLKRLLESGYIQVANLRGRNSYYFIAERLYAIWHQMRFGREARKRMGWLVNTLKALYDSAEIESRIDLLSKRFTEQLELGRTIEARGVLEHRRYLIEAMSSKIAGPKLTSKYETIIHDYIRLKEVKALSDVLQDVQLDEMSDETLNTLLDEGCIDTDKLRKTLWRRSSKFSQEGNYERAIADANRIIAFESDQSNEFVGYMTLMFALEGMGRYEEVIAAADRVLEILPDFDFARASRGKALYELGRYEEAIENYDEALKLSDFLKITYWNGKAAALHGLGRHDEALANTDLVLASEPDNWFTWLIRGSVLAALGRAREAITSLRRATKLKPDEYFPWLNLGKLLEQEGKNKKALESLDKAVKLNVDHSEAWVLRASILAKMEEHAEAVKSFDRALEIDPDDFSLWFNRGSSLRLLGKYEEALESYDHAITTATKQNLPELGWLCSMCHLLKSLICAEQGNFDLAKSEWTRGISYFNNDISPLLDIIMFVSLQLVRAGHITFVRQLVEESDWSAQLFPLARAIDYIQTGDRSLVEKLSPEVRIVVEENIDGIRTMMPAKS